MKSDKSHHLAKHSLSGEIDLQLHFGTADPKEVAREIARLGQKQLQAKFNQIFAAKTYSNNNQWLRRKLLEAAGIQPPKSTGRGRSTQLRRSPSPADGSAGSSGPLPCAAALASTTTGSAVAVVRSLLHPVNTEVRRTKRKRRPRTFDDMLPLDPPASSSDNSSEEEVGADPDFDFNCSDSGSPIVRPQKVARSHFQAGPSQWRSSSGSLSRSSMVSSQSELAFANIFKSNHQLHQPRSVAGFVHAQHVKSARQYARRDADELIRAATVSSRSSLPRLRTPAISHSSSHLSQHAYGADAAAAAAAAAAARRARMSGRYDLGANRVRIATPHSTAAQAQVCELSLYTAQHSGPDRQPAPRHPQLPPSSGMHADVQHHDSPPVLVQSREGGAGSLEGEEFANSCLSESFLNDMQTAQGTSDLVTSTSLPLLQRSNAGVMQHSPSFSAHQATTTSAAGSLESASCPAASAIRTMATAHSRQTAQQIAPEIAAPCAHLTPPPASTTTPMDMIMLQSLTSVPEGELACSAGELLPESMLMEDSILAMPTL